MFLVANFGRAGTRYEVTCDRFEHRKKEKGEARRAREKKRRVSECAVVRRKKERKIRDGGWTRRARRDERGKERREVAARVARTARRPSVPGSGSRAWGCWCLLACDEGAPGSPRSLWPPLQKVHLSTHFFLLVRSRSSRKLRAKRHQSRESGSKQNIAK